MCARFYNGGCIIKINYYEKKYILDGLGICNKAVKSFFDKNNIDYVIYDDAFINEEINLVKYDFLIKSPGVPLNQNLVRQAKELNIQIISDLELFYLLKPNQKYISVTGSNGKTTTIYFIHQFLNMLNIHHHLAGNIGIPLFSIIDKVKEDELILIECSSFMLEAIKEFSPHIHIITNIFPHHLIHHQDFKNYFEAKISPIKKGTICIYPNNCSVVKSEIIKKEIENYSFSQEPRKGNFWINNNLISINDKVYYSDKLKLFSNTDQLDLLISLGAIEILKKHYGSSICIDSLIKRIDDLQKYPYRQQEIINSNQFLIINDSKATNYYATVAAVNNLQERSLDNNEYKILIIGGENQDYSKCNFKFLEYFDQIIIYGENRYYLEKLVNKYTKTDICDNLNEVWEIIMKIKNRTSNQKRLLILFSPMSASHDQYKSYIERGEHFNELVNVHLNHF